ncbi:MAG TPA: Firmicu-CTERM sorting domain-containing protein [Desulfosporosinus sp.]|nr:Firmicu-CTERM sorting domain-containing protein [Desulfosporosinus sp.]
MKKAVIQTIVFLFFLMLAFPSPCYGFDYGAIQIDGYYDDWEDKPHTHVYYGTLPNVSEIHLVSLFRDETTLYVHVKMSENNYNEFPNSNLKLSTNAGSMAYLVNLDSLPGKKKPVEGTAGLTVRLQNNWNYIVGSGYYTRTDGEPDEAEFFIPLSTISAQPSGITEITMRIYELGHQLIICVGANTGPYIGAAICAVIAFSSGGYYYYRKKKNQC